jgi:ferredoxin
MKTLHLYYFSGTGVTAWVAERIGRGMAARGYSVELLNIEELAKGERAMPSARPDLAGFGCPVMGFGAPRIVRGFLRRLPMARDVAAFVFRTEGGVGPINERASAQMLRALRRKGYRPFYERQFALASNWVRPHAPAVVRRLALATERKIEAACGDLAAEKGRLPRVGLFRAIALDSLRAVCIPGLYLAGRDLAASGLCSGCGACARRCPTGNIRLEPGSAARGPLFGNRCTLCLRCVYGCPGKAVAFKRFAFIAIPGGFDLRDALARAGAEASRDESPDRIPPFLEGYESDSAI